MSDRSAGMVECADCHRVYEMTPLDDHYEPAWGGPKVCYRCLLVQWDKRGRYVQSGVLDADDPMAEQRCGECMALVGHWHVPGCRAQEATS